MRQSSGVTDPIIGAGAADELDAGAPCNYSAKILAVVVWRGCLEPGPGRVRQFSTDEPHAGLEPDVVTKPGEEIVDGREVAPQRRWYEMSLREPVIKRSEWAGEKDTSIRQSPLGLDLRCDLN